MDLKVIKKNNVTKIKNTPRIFIHKFNDSPVVLDKASVNPEMYKAHEKTFATKNNTPILPPNSGPNVLLIISKLFKNN